MLLLKINVANMDLLDEKQRKRLVRVIVKSNIIVACIYIAICLLFPSLFCWRFLIFLIFISWLASYCFRLYTHESIKEKIHTITKPVIKKQWWKMPLWEWGHWAIVVVFFFLTAWAMWSGLNSLFKESGSNSWFVLIFTLCVTFTLFWLVIMITRNRHIWGFILFYIIFDVLSAFTFNFIHFYDNVSATQRTDATMKACQMFLDLEKSTISNVLMEAETKQRKVNQAETNYNKENSNRKQQIKDLKEIRRGLNVNNNNNNNDNNDNNKKSVAEIDKSINTLVNEITKNVNSTMSHDNNELQINANVLMSNRDSLARACMLYNQGDTLFSDSLVEKSKSYVFAIHDLLKDKEQNLQEEDRETIKYVLHTIQQKGGNRFDSFVQLYSLLNNAITEVFGTNLKDSISTDSSQISKYQELVVQEKRLEAGILYQSIALSALIDAVPLALGIFVSWVKRREEDEKFEKMNAA